ncbi:Lon protease C-terminal proteolytic domain-containing protein [Dunaliella salina]|uniref:Lon protease C-terminal proteolytic domain-containing protein n=1 Tax=Dunaliella salina TaxID=3046 RepID=A0ABQ7GFM2_DUNSA|nr:Lon protease C-terminal proteolytic domain-containing protein [Dunaliella salina]|eukprot:KAF5833405.1 Lon protease C-terminal proteolytic domain-containing protein [Dunaliella salina]
MCICLHRYTNEAGVRGLSRCLAAICRHVAVCIITQRDNAAALGALPPSHTGPPHTQAHQEDAGALAFPALQHAAAAAPSALASSPPPSAAPSAAGGPHEIKLESHPNLQPPVPPLPQSLHGSLAAVAEAPLLGFPLDAHPASVPGELQGGGSGALGNQHHSKQGSGSSGHGGGFRSWLFGAVSQPEASRMGTIDTAGQSSSSSSSSGRHGARSSYQQRAFASNVASSELGGEGEAADCFPYPPDLLQQHAEATVVTEQLVESVLGPPPYGGSEAQDRVQAPGAATGLVWTSTGGSVQYIECVRTSVGQRDRPGTLTLTGQVGEVLEESAQIALSWIRAHAYELQLEAPGSSSSSSSSHRPSELAAAPAHTHSVGSNANGDVSAGSSDALASHRTHGQHPLGSPRAHSQHLLGSPRAHSQHLLGSPRAHSQDLLDSPRARSQHLMGSLLSSPDTASKHSARIELLNPASCWDLHLHLPAGAIPKDGPSAGITIAVTLISVLTGRCVRSDTAMTGELTLRGLVLPVGGLKEKLLAARRAGLSRAIVPARNMPEIVAEVSPAVRAALQIVPVQRLEEALEAAFDPPLYLLPRPRL